MHSQEPIPKGRMERIKELEILVEKTSIPEQKMQANAKLAKLKLENRLEWERINSIPVN